MSINEIKDLQKRVEQAERERARAEGTRDAAQNALDNAFRELKDDFGVDTLPEAEELLESLHADLQMAINKLTGQLAKIGA